jgi:SH3 domain protein
MKRLIAFGICLILGSMAAPAAGNTGYVTDIMKITMRTGQGLDHKILAMVQSGNEVEIVEPGDQWTRIRLSDGKEGWVLSRFLTSKKPNRLILENLQKKYDAILIEKTSLMKENKEMREKTNTLTEELAAKEKALNEQIASYETLKKESGDFLALKANYQKSAKIQADLSQKTAIMEEELDYLRTQHIFKWFLSGAGVLLLGFIIGFSSRRSRRRSSLL